MLKAMLTYLINQYQTSCFDVGETIDDFNLLHLRERSSNTSSGFAQFFTPHPPKNHRDHQRPWPPTPLNCWQNTWMSVTSKNVQFCKESTIWFAGWPDESAKNTTIYSPFRTWSELSNNRIYKFQFVLMYNVTFIRNIIRSGW